MGVWPGAAADRPAPEAIPTHMTVAKGSPFTIDLPCAAGRGFSWQLADSSDQSNVQFLRESVSNGPEDKDGADAIQHFYFKAIESGTTTIKFIYVQPFRKPYPKDARVADVTVTIK
jgi:predicted secreted protein